MTNLQSTQLSQQLLRVHHLPVSPTYLTTFLSTVRNPPPPLPALISTLNFRILASDITQSVSTSSPVTLLPPNIGDVNTKSRSLTSPVVVQILDIWDVGSSKWSQIEAIERVERGEEVRGREVIRTVPIMDEEGGSGGADGRGANAATAITGSSSTKKSLGPHKLLLQDAAGTKVMAFEQGKIPKIAIGEDGICIGCKLLLHQGLAVRRGMVMLKAEDVQVLGGKVEAWDVKWKEGRKRRLLEEVQGQHGDNREQQDG